MPFYTYRTEDGEEIEKLFSIQDRPDEIKENGKLFTRVLEVSGNFILKGTGWVSKGSGNASSAKHGKEIGLAVDHDKKREMEND